MLKGEQRHSTLDKFIDKYEMTRRPETQLFRDKVGYNKDIMKSAAKSEHGQNELSDVTLDIEGLNTVDLFEDDTFIDVDALLGTNKKKSNRSGRSSNRSSQNGSSNQNSRKSGSRGRRSSRGSSGTTTTTLYEMYQDPYEADAAADNEPEVDLDLNLDALLQEDFGDMLMTNDDEDKNETSVNDDIMTDNPVQDNTSDMMNGNNDLVIPNDTIVPLEENAPANNADNIGDMPAAAEPIAQDENGAAEPNPPDENIIPAAEQQTEQEHPAETVAEPEVHADNGAVPADNAEGEVKPEQNNANNEDFFLDL
ncbi:MAG: hypothetical protein J6Y01_08270 [Spirochaetales bacterium]|nr:hypothetical protein [Spirochaetales bacterium]